MNIRIVTASAGSGKTFKLTSILDDEIAAQRAQPEAVVAVTFTKQAAAELVERARGRLLENGRGFEAHRLLAARIGTVNSVCGSLVSDFAFELGLSPAIRVLDETAAELEFLRAIATVVTADVEAAMEEFRYVFTDQLDWRHEVRRVVEAARANNLDAEALRACGTRSKADLDAVLGPMTTEDLDAQLDSALVTAIAALERSGDTTKATAKCVQFYKDARRELSRHALRWGDWAKLTKPDPSKKVVELCAQVRAVAERHIVHPRLRERMHDFIEGIFDIAARSLMAYQAHKRAAGVMDFIDQEAHALELLRRPPIRAALAGQIDLFLVDEFQDTSPLQLALFLEIARLAKESVWVGDPKQAIYGFRGTDPVLMDAAIESLTSVTNDGDLVSRATEAISKGVVERLDVSYRSRPGLVRLTNEVFARAFAHQGIPEDRTRLRPKLDNEPAGLDDIVQVWPLDASNAEQRAQAVAAGVRDLLEHRPMVREGDGNARHVRRKDVAVLCRTNAQCREVATALGDLGVVAVVPRVGLTKTAEAMVVLAGLALWADPGDAIAAAEIARLITYPDDLDAFTARAIERASENAFHDDVTVQRIHAAQRAERDLGPLAVLDAVMEATSVRTLSADWGETSQRLANLDALRAHAVAYVERARSAGDPVTLVGMLGHLDALGAANTWREQPRDSQAIVADEDAVTLSTWHAAKGLEWPVTVLYGLESIKDASSWGVHVLSDRAAFDVTDPLGGRWIRSWPFPYTTTNQQGPVRAAVEASAGHAILADRAAREALRVLYVGWTRARDRLVFAAAPGKLLFGILRTLVQIDPVLISEPLAAARSEVRVTWAGVQLSAIVAPAVPVAPVAAAPTVGEVTVGAPTIVRAPAYLAPSETTAIAATIGELFEIGPCLSVRGAPDMQRVGHAVHGFLAADRQDLSDAEREELAGRLLEGFEVIDSLAPADVVNAATRFWRWCETRYPGGRLHREWPVAWRRPEGTVLSGTADLVISTPDALAVVDHKSFPGTPEAALARALAHAGQLQAYASVIAAATKREVTGRWIHFPVLGRLVEVRTSSVVAV